MKLRPFAAVILLVLFAGNASAQERLTPEEMFRWFPAGKYDEINHYDLSVARKQPGFQIYFAEGVNKLENWSNNIVIPTELADNYLSVTAMSTVRLVVYQSEAPRKLGRGAKIAGDKFGYKTYWSNSFGYRMIVLRPQPNKNLNDLLQYSDSVKPTDKLINRRPVYVMDSDKFRGEKVSYYLWITPEQELLICENLELLKKMIAVGSGAEPGVLDDFPYPELLEILPELGPGWTFVTYRPAYNAIKLKAVKDGIDPEEIKAVRDAEKNPDTYIFDSLFENPPRKRTISIFPNKELAKNDYEHRLDYKPQRRFMKDVYAVLAKHNFITLKDNLVSFGSIYTPEYIDAYKKQKAYFQKLREERIKRQQKEAQAAANKSSEQKPQEK